MDDDPLAGICGQEALKSDAMVCGSMTPSLSLGEKRESTRALSQQEKH